MSSLRSMLQPYLHRPAQAPHQHQPSSAGPGPSHASSQPPNPSAAALLSSSSSLQQPPQRIPYSVSGPAPNCTVSASTQAISLSTFQASYQSYLSQTQASSSSSSSSSSQPSQRSQQQLLPSLTSEQYETLEALTSPDNLSSPNASLVSDIYRLDQAPEGMKLTTVLDAVKAVRKPRETNYYVPPKPKAHKSKNTIPRDEIVVSIAMYHAGKSSRMSEFLVLGSQRLCELKDKLYCPSDVIGGGQLRPSSYFFIEGVFYNDMRAVNAVDYSEPVLSWISEPSNTRSTHTGLGHFRAAHMERTRFSDLSVRLGQSYLYCHQGDCEHILVFRDVRLVNFEVDSEDADQFPKQIYQAKVKQRKCRVCDIYPTKFVTYNDRLAAETPAYFCETCYDLLHNDASGQPLYEHTVTEYFHEA